MTYRITIKRKGHKDIVKSGVDLLNATIIPAELEIAFPDAIKSGSMKVIVEEEK